jgi:hypothetical protein
MTTTPTPAEGPKVTKADVAERAEAFREEAIRGSRTLLTGDANGRVRRNLLFVLALVGYVDGLHLIGLVALILLALTDMVVVD